MLRHLEFVAVAILVCACTPAPTPAPHREPVPASKPTSGPRLVRAPAGGRVAEVVAAERELAGDDLIVVYVGATWCEPCIAFHEAVAAGQFSAEFAGVRFLEFDLDRDNARLTADDYTSRYVPLFVVPGPDGRASDHRLQGGTKGPDAAQALAQRLGPWIAAARAKATASP